MVTWQRIRHLLTIVLVASLAARAALAQQVPERISYQGSLIEADATPVDGTVDLAFAFYARETGGGPIDGWTERHDDEPVRNGRFDVVLGSRAGGLPSALFDDGAERWLEVRIDGEALPRVRLTSALFALQARNVVDGAIDTPALADDAVTGAKLSDGAAVRSLNELTGDVQIEGEGAVTVRVEGNAVRIGADGGGGGGGIQAIENTDGALAIDGPDGGTVTIDVESGGITSSMLDGDAAVRSLNGQTGAVALTSEDGTVAIDTDGGTIDLSAPGGDGGGLTRVNTDGTLTGDGTAGDALGVATGGVDTEQLAGGSVTAGKLEPGPPSQDGRVLSFADGSLTWIDVDGGGGRSVNTDETLSGTGTPGNPLGLASGGVATEHLADAAVTTDKVQDAQIGAAKLAADLPGDDDAYVLAYEGGALEWREADDVGDDGPSLGGAQRSSLRFKEDVEPIEDPVALVEALRGVRFAWKADGRADVGVIAEEVAEVLPELVAFEEDGRARGVHYAKLTAVLIEALKAQQTDLEAQTRIIDRQEAAIDALTRRMARLERRVERENAPSGPSETGHDRP